MTFETFFAVATSACCLSYALLAPPDDKPPVYHSFDYEVARAHEVEPYRHQIPLKGVHPGFNQLQLKLKVSVFGDVVAAEAESDPATLKFWPELEAEVLRWKFTPFEKDGKVVAALVEEYLVLLPMERLPEIHAAAPPIRPDSKVIISLERTACYGWCPNYSVSVSTDGIVFNGRSFVAASGKHTDRVNPNEVRNLARRFVAADFYSMESEYRDNVTDNPTYILSISIDGRTKQVVDYVGAWEGMPAVISDLEDEVDKFARTERWIKASDGLVTVLHDEKFDFRTIDAQALLQQASARGALATVRDLLDAGVPLDPLPNPKPPKPEMGVDFHESGWLTAASSHADVLKLLIAAAANKTDQRDKDLGLAGAARSGNLEGARSLIAYGANPNADLSKLIITRDGEQVAVKGSGSGSILIFAAKSGKPDMVREILRYRPQLEARDHDGKTALFAAEEYGYRDEEGARLECVRLLADAGANVNARDGHGNTPLHQTVLLEVDEELLRRGADVNARNDDGDTPTFTTWEPAAFPLFIAHGADLTIRNNNGKTALEFIKENKPHLMEAFTKALQDLR
jgi:ankyrin repeat protein